MENSFHNGQAGEPIEVPRKVEILAEFEARHEFNYDRNNGHRIPFKCAGFARINKALADLGFADETEEDRVRLGIAFATKFRDTYERLAFP